MGRPKLHETNAERQAAYRARNATTDIRLLPETMVTLDKIAELLDTSRVEVINSMLNFALLNRNWSVEGLFGKRLVRHTTTQHRRSGDTTAK